MTKRQKLERDQGEGYMRESTFETALNDLKENGYFWIRQVVPEELCKPCATAIQKDVGKRLDEGSPHQEEPIERLNPHTVKLMKELREFVIEKVMIDKLETSAEVPDNWTETLYGRVKRANFHTRWHCDAFNTLFERGLLEKANLPSNVKQNPIWSKIRKTGMVSCDWDEIPIFTFWVALRPVTSPACSHLRLFPQSHQMESIQLQKELRNFVPGGWCYNKQDFVGPSFPGGYTVGDLVVFHCFTQHEANAHTVKVKADKAMNSERISLDGRFFLQLT